MNNAPIPSRRHLMAAAALAPVAASLLGACASGAGTPLRSSATRQTIALSEVPDSLPGAQGACDELGAALIAHHLQNEPHRNAMSSGLSLSLLLAILADGATDPAAQGYDALLGASGEQRDRTWSALQTSLNRNDRSLAGFSPEEPPAKPLVHLANHVVVLDSLEVAQSYLDTVMAFFTTEIEQVPMSALKSSLDTWASRNTAGLIPSSAIEIRPDLRLVVQSALLFAARWESPFPPENSAPQPFTLADSSTVEATFMHDTRFLRHAQGPDWSAVRLPYSGGHEDPGSTAGPEGSETPDQPALALDVILPQKGTLPAQMDAASWAQASAALDEAPLVDVELSLPKADLTTGAMDLVEVITGLGLDPAGLDRIAPDLKIDQIVQQVRLTMDEEGTVAAALTEAGVAVLSAPLPPNVTFTVDRPYVLRLRDLVSGITLLEAAVMNPADSEG
ncbi:serpin family protein [Actinomyces bowdenii]|uniref:Serpin n=1 Tax=Actinomyces bowdenii TaxID=131109 RepID=A0A853EKB2_9ACTO|nr:serpin family protein [Actinomyces bowdenii]MBF0697526.1 serpin [Actinomyces bowdenii]NYS69699.1 serpin [Actinomyces bowdenii]